MVLSALKTYSVLILLFIKPHSEEEEEDFIY